LKRLKLERTIFVIVFIDNLPLIYELAIKLLI
jgi:hypothetical protein